MKKKISDGIVWYGPPDTIAPPEGVYEKHIEDLKKLRIEPQFRSWTWFRLLKEKRNNV